MYSVTIHRDGSKIALGISNPKSGEILSIEQFEIEAEDFENQLKILFEKQNIKNLSSNSHKNVLYLDNVEFTLIPSAFFHESQLLSLVKPVLSFAKNEVLKFNLIPEIDAYLVYKISRELEHFVKSTIGHAVFRHHFGSLISTYNLFYCAKNTTTAFVQLQNENFTLALFEGNKLLHFNSFKWSGLEDILYFTYYSMDQYNLDPATTDMYIGGNMDFTDETIAAFQRYSSKIYKITPTLQQNMGDSQTQAFINAIFDIQCG